MMLITPLIMIEGQKILLAIRQSPTQDMIVKLMMEVAIYGDILTYVSLRHQ